MVLLQSFQGLTETGFESVIQRIGQFEQQQHRFGVLLDDSPEGIVGWNILQAVGDSVLARNGQFLSLDVSDLGETRFTNQLLAALENFRGEKTFRINLPLTLNGLPRSDSPFINRAIIWQRLCDRIIEDEETDRATFFVLKTLDQAVRSDRHDIARLIRFHQTHRIRRTFFATVRKEDFDMLEPEIRELVDLAIEI